MHRSARESHRSEELAARCDGFSLEAGRHLHENDRRGLEALLRYGLRPPLAQERLSRASEKGGELVLRLERPMADGQTTLRLTPLELLRRLAGLVPPPRVHQVHYFGGFASHSSIRSRIVPRSPKVRRRCRLDSACSDQLELALPARAARRSDESDLMPLVEAAPGGTRQHCPEAGFPARRVHGYRSDSPTWWLERSLTADGRVVLLRVVAKYPALARGSGWWSPPEWPRYGPVDLLARLAYYRQHTSAHSRPQTPGGDMLSKPEVYTKEEAAEIMKISTRQFDRMVEKFALPVMKFGTSVRIRRVDLVRWLKLMSKPMTLKEAALFLGLEASSILSLANTARLPVETLADGTHVFFEAQLDEWRRDREDKNRIFHDIDDRVRHLVSKLAANNIIAKELPCELCAMQTPPQQHVASTACKLCGKLVCLPHALHSLKNGRDMREDTDVACDACFAKWNPQVW